MGLTHHDIKWNNPEMNISDIITSCREFSNVPLIETRGRINYNPMLSLCQLGYAMDGEPFDKDVVDSIFL